jgi:hypothetical protein
LDQEIKAVLTGVKAHSGVAAFPADLSEKFVCSGNNQPDVIIHGMSAAFLFITSN